SVHADEATVAAARIELDLHRPGIARLLELDRASIERAARAKGVLLDLHTLAGILRGEGRSRGEGAEHREQDELLHGISRGDGPMAGPSQYARLSGRGARSGRANPGHADPTTCSTRACYRNVYRQRVCTTFIIFRAALLRAGLRS